MPYTTNLMPILIDAIDSVIKENAEEVTVLDQTLGDGDHVINLQRGIEALKKQSDEYPQLNWSEVWKKIGMTLLNTMGGASGSLFGTFFINLSKSSKNETALNQQAFSAAYIQAVEAVKKRGKSDIGEKTMLDTLVPISILFQNNNKSPENPSDLLDNVAKTAIIGMESTREMLATKGRASYLQEKSIGHIDAGAKTCQLIICAIIKVLKIHLPE
jgi:dihydroxyacetone kinase-like protein